MLHTLRRKKTLRIAGLMSGTSADGVDVAIVDIGPRGVRQLAFGHQAYPPALRAAIFELFDAERATVDRICHMNFVLGEVFAKAVVRTASAGRVPLESIDAVGSHGQTIYHIPMPRPWVPGDRRRTASTLQIGEPSVIAERTGITTVADFRPRDIAAGGQGAPLVPLADWVLLRDKRLSRAVQNIGGIANVTCLPAGGAVDAVRAFDTGPGNMIIDRCAQRVTNGRLAYDRGGKLAAAGSVSEPLLAELLRHPYLKRRPPKTTGREDFGVQFTDELWGRAAKLRLRDADLMATVTAFTVRSIADAYARFLGPVDEMILCGGGARNPVLVEMLRRKLPCPVRIIDELGISVEAKEAVSFAILAERTLRAQPGNVPSATGAGHGVVLGKVVFGLRRRGDAALRY